LEAASGSVAVTAATADSAGSEGEVAMEVGSVEAGWAEADAEAVGSGEVAMEEGSAEADEAEAGSEAAGWEAAAMEAG
jgi:hypothetical protein